MIFKREVCIYTQIQILDMEKTKAFYKLPKHLIGEYGVTATLLLADLAERYQYYSNHEMLNSNGEFFVTLQQIKESTGLGENTIKRTLPKLSEAFTYETRMDRVTKYTKEQLTYYIKFPTRTQQTPFGLVSQYISSISEGVDEQGYHFLLNPISTENINTLVRLMKRGWSPDHIFQYHMLGKITTLEQIEAVYQVYYE